MQYATYSRGEAEGETQDQTVKVAEARELEQELQRTREENADLRKRLNEVSSLESAKKKADARVEQLEQKVTTYCGISYNSSAH